MRTKPIPVEFILVDTREKRPLWECPPAIPWPLETGDYSLLDYHDRIAIERKSVADAYGSVGRRRDEFLMGVRRLSQMDFGAVVVEGTLRDIVKHRRRGKVSPAQVIGTLLSWCCVAYRVPLLFVEDRFMARQVILTWLRLAKDKCDAGRTYRHYGVICPCGGAGPVPHAARCKYGEAP